MRGHSHRGLANAYYAWVFPYVKYAHFCPRIKCAFYAWAFSPWVFPRILCAFLPMHKMRISSVGIPTVGLPMHNTRCFSHVYYAHFFPRIKCAYVLIWAFPRWVCPCIKCVGFPTYIMRIFSHA